MCRSRELAIFVLTAMHTQTYKPITLPLLRMRARRVTSKLLELEQPLLTTPDEQVFGLTLVIK